MKLKITVIDINNGRILFTTPNPEIARVKVRQFRRKGIATILHTESR